MSNLDLPTSISIGNEYTLYAVFKRNIYYGQFNGNNIGSFICNEVLHSNVSYSRNYNDLTIFTKRGVYNFYDKEHDIFKFSGRRLRISEEFARKCYYMDKCDKEFKTKYSSTEEFEKYIVNFIRKELNITNDYVFLDKEGHITDTRLGEVLFTQKDAEKFNVFYIVKLDPKNIEFDTETNYNKEPLLKTFNSITVYKQLYLESIKHFCKKYNVCFLRCDDTDDILKTVNDNICFGTLRFDDRYDHELHETFDDMMKKLVNQFAELLLTNMYDGQLLSDLEELCCDRQSIIKGLSKNIIKGIDEGISNIKINGIK